MNSSNLPVTVGGVVIDAFVAVAAAAVNGFFVISIWKLTTSVDLGNTSQNVEKLCDTARFCCFPTAASTEESGAHKPGL